MGRRTLTNTGEIVSRIKAGEYARQIAEECGVSVSTVYNLAKRNGLDYKKAFVLSDYDDRHRTVKRMSEEGYTVTEISQRLGIDSHNLRKWCVKNGVDTNVRPKKNSIKTVEGVVESVGLEYVDGYENNRSHITVKAECGHKFDVAWLTIVDSGKQPPCPVCRSIKSSSRNISKQKKRMEREAYRGVQVGFDSCPVCGAMVIGSKYCSKKCRDKLHNTANWTRRHRLINATVVDDDITLEALYRRDNGVCHLCGGTCDFNDSTVKDGVFIALDTYPSIDHLQPLSCGGTHTWNNVRLAHRVCNSRRGNTPLVKNGG